MDPTKHEVLVVGAGMAGLTAAAYAAKAGLKPLVLERNRIPGGLVNSFERGGFVWDGGLRAIEDSGIMLPMLRQLGIDMEFMASTVSIGFGNDVIRLSSGASLRDYHELLRRHFPAEERDIDAIIGEVSRVMDYMDVLYGIDNPLFLDLKNDPKYVFRTILPWLLKYILTMPKVAKLGMPVDEYLAGFTKNRSLVDMIAQHFFQKTPTFFALSYFSLYLGYRYPKGGTGMLPAKMAGFIRDNGGEIRTETQVVRVDAGKKVAVDSTGKTWGYDRMIWCADARTLYRILDSGSIPDAGARDAVAAKGREIADLKGGDSVFTLNLALNLAPEYFRRIASAHFFYTPSMEGLSAAGPVPAAPAGTGGPSPSAGGRFSDDREALFAWVGRYLDLTTFEMSIPALRDPDLAPEGKTGIIISTLMDYSLVRHFRDLGLYDEFCKFCAARIVRILETAIFPGLGAAVIDSFTSSPLTIESVTGNSDGAITGWAFTNPSMPAVHRLPQIARSILTPIPGVLQAGQWSFSPSGLPVSILTGKLAADRAVAELRPKRARG